MGGCCCTIHGVAGFLYTQMAHCWRSWDSFDYACWPRGDTSLALSLLVSWKLISSGSLSSFFFNLSKDILIKPEFLPFQILTNFLSSIMIHATRPFVRNERIQIKIEGYEVSGTVEVSNHIIFELKIM